MAKTAPWFVHYGCVPGLYPDSAFLLTASMLKPTQTPFIAGPLGVRLNRSLHTVKSFKKLSLSLKKHTTP
jgi:hypothetical protein